MNKLIDRIFIPLSLFLIILRLIFISNTVLINDEAYYAIYARHLAWGYVDHGPVVAYLIKFSDFKTWLTITRLNRLNNI